jgi:hypothetical protein
LESGAERQWLTPIILATQEAESRRITVRSQTGQTVRKNLSRKTLSQKIGLVEWLKVKALSSSPIPHTKNWNLGFNTEFLEIF